MNRTLKYFSASLFLTAMFVFTVLGQTTAFSYQGFFKDGSAAANGNYDFEFRLYNAITGGSQVDSTNFKLNVPVADGHFSVLLDFNAAGFTGPDRYLEIRARPSGTVTYTTLTPRSFVSSSPYSIQAVQATNATLLGNVPAANYLQSGSAAINAGTQFNIGGNRVFATPATENTFAGVNAGAGSSNTVGNTFLGFNAGQNNSSAGQNTAVGARAGQNTNGTGNSYFGYNAGNANTSGGGNSFFGNGAGDSNTASDNSFFGNSAGGANTTGIQNSFFGKHAGLSNVTATENSYFGFEAGRNATASFNSFFGSRAGQANTSGSSNAFFGTAAGVANSTGSDNSYFGVNTGVTNTTGAGNSYFGRRAGRDSTTGSNNTAVGIDAGRDNLTGSNNTLIGAGADVGSGNLSFATAIGAGAVVSNSDEIVLGRNDDTVRVKGYFRVDDSAKLVGSLDIDSFIEVQEVLLRNNLTAGGSTSVCVQLFHGSDFPPGYPFGDFYMFTRCGSSIKLKSDVATSETGISTLRKLRPVHFNWKSNGSPAIGLIAEEVNEVEPLLAARETDGTVFGVNFDAVTAVLVKSVQEQQAQIEAQKEQIDEATKVGELLQEKLTKQTEVNREMRSEIDLLKKLFCGSNPDAALCKKE